MTTVNDLLRDKSSDIWTIGPDETMFDALKLLGEKNIGAVLVMEGGRLVGLLSERDYARKVLLKGRRSRETKVREVMSTDVTSVTSRTAVEECLSLMTDRRFRHLPVMDNDKLIGLISMGDLVKAIIEDQRDLIGQLEQYISGQ
ncbi:MAG: CBS domain-containing protein [Salinisphaera sp.]|jgi:CBS domain-containing protein|nr:CBS domain-containing protein [Salinisphaera sp.]